MTTFDEAKKIAKKINPKVDVYQEYSDAFIFFIKDPKQDDVWDNEVVIKKSDGKVISYTKYIMTSKYFNDSAEDKRV